MAWTEITRKDYDRRGQRYASDMTDREWGLIAPPMPPRKTNGRPRTTALREVMNAILYMASTGCQWTMLPKDFPPPSTVQRYFYDWSGSGLLRSINYYLVMEARELEGREASPSAGVIDSQSVKTTESGLLIGFMIHSAGIQDRDGAPEVHKSIRQSFPWLRHVFADGGYGGPKLRGDLDKIGDWTVEIIKRSDTADGFEILPRRWVVERTFAWLGRCRRLAKDWEKIIASAEAWLLIAHIRALTR